MKKSLLRAICSGSLILVLSLVSVTLFSSGSGEKSTDSGSADSGILKAGEYTLPIVKNQVTLSLAIRDHFKQEFTLSEPREIWQEIEKRTNVKIDWQVIYGANDYKQAINVRVAAATELPDLFWTHGQKNLDPIKLNKEKLTIKTTDLIKKYAPNILRHIKTDDLVRALMVAPDGQIYCAVPSVKAHKKTIDFTNHYHRQDWRKKLGIKEPETIDDFYEMLKAFREKDPNGNGEKDEVPWVMRYSTSIMALGDAYNLVGNGPGFYREGNTIKNMFVMPKYKDYIQFMQKVYNNGLTHKSIILKNNQVNQLVSTDRCGMVQANIGNCNRYDNLLKKTGVDIEEGGYFINPPVLNTVTGKREYRAASHVSDSYLVITTTCKYPEVAIRWLDYVWGSEEGQTLTNWGFPDKTYTIDKQGKKRFTDAMLDHPKGYSPEEAVWSIGGKLQGLTYYTADAFHAHFEKVSKLYNIPLYTKKYMNPEIMIPDTIATLEEAEEYSALFTDWSTYKEESMVRFITGNLSLDQFDDYLDKLNQLGTDKLIAILQKQYDRFKSITF